MIFIELEYTISMINYEKMHNELKASSFAAKYDSVNTKPDFVGKIFIFLTSALDGPETIECDDIVANFIDFTTAESLKLYLSNAVFPFIDELINKFSSENMALGITQAGKTGHVLGLFEKGYDVRANGFPISIKATFDTGSLYESIEIIDHLVANTGEIDGLSPYVTVERLTNMKSEIVGFLT